jgi:DNA-directed RNA polymerase subunit RPC12/RpoP
MYLVLVCYNCGQFLLAKTGQKTKRCPYCDARLALEKARKIGSASDAYQALHLVQALKTKKNRA